MRILKVFVGISTLFSFSLFAASASWDVDQSAAWSFDAFWNPPSHPDGIGEIATFPNIITTPTDIFVDGNFTVGGILFDSDISYNILPLGPGTSLIFEDAGNAFITAAPAALGTHSIQAPIILNSPLQVIGGSTVLTLSGPISGAQEVYIDGNSIAGSVLFSGTEANTYSGATYINPSFASGSLFLGKTANVNAIAGDIFIINGGILTLVNPNQIADTSTMTMDLGSTFNMNGNVETIGSLVFNGGTVNQGGAILSLASASTALSMRDVILNGPISILNGGAVVFENLDNGTAVIDGNINLNGFTTTFNIADGTALIDMLVSGVISNGGIIKEGEGTLLLTGANTYSGGTLVSAGTLIGDTISLQGNIINNANLVFDQIFDGTYAGMITGIGNLFKEGSGNLTLSNINSQTGLVALNEGTLTVTGVLGGGGPMTVAAGATLTGTGTIAKNTTIFGTLSPGIDIGTINFIGNQVFAPGSILENKLNPTITDHVFIQGTLTIQPGSTLALMPEPGVYPDSFSYLLVQTTGGVFGTFSTITSTLPLFMGTVTYTPFNILAVRVSLLPFSFLFSRGNAGAVAHCLDNHAPAMGTELFSIINTLRMIPSVLDLEDALLQLQPSAFTSLSIAQENNTINFQDAIHTHLEEQNCGHDFYSRSSFWISPYGAHSIQRGRHEEAGFKATSPGVVAGLDLIVDPQSIFGLGVGYNYTNLHWNKNRGHAELETAYVSIYGRKETSAWYLQSSLTGGYNDYETDRHIAFGTFQPVDRHAVGKHHGLEGSLEVKGGLLFSYGDVIFSPFANLDYMYLHEDGFSEKGAGVLNLKLRSKDSDLFESEVGVNISRCLRNSYMTIHPFIQLSVLRESKFKGRTENAIFLGDCPLEVRGLNPSRPLGKVVAGMNTTISEKTVSLFYSGRYGSGFNDQAIYLQFQWAL